MKKSELFIRFPDQSSSFTLGVEFGRLLEKMERGNECIFNNGFPIRLENVEVIRAACYKIGYIPTFGDKYFDEWIDFFAIKNNIRNN